MSSYQERQLLCGLTSSRQDPGALSKVLTDYPVRAASEGRAVQGTPPYGGGQLLFLLRLVEVLLIYLISLMSAILSWELSISDSTALYNYH